MSTSYLRTKLRRCCKTRALQDEHRNATTHAGPPQQTATQPPTSRIDNGERIAPGILALMMSSAARQMKDSSLRSKPGSASPPRSESQPNYASKCHLDKTLGRMCGKEQLSLTRKRAAAQKDIDEYINSTLRKRAICPMTHHSGQKTHRQIRRAS
jgi:hypothetical protein